VRNAGRREFDNFQCRTVAGIGDRKQFGKVNEHDLEIALENLRTFEFIGIFEDLERSVERLNRLVPSLQASMPVVNKGSYDKAISYDDLAAAREINRYDEILIRKRSNWLPTGKLPERQRRDGIGQRTVIWYWNTLFVPFFVCVFTTTLSAPVKPKSGL
jgi:hypothetical protein